MNDFTPKKKTPKKETINFIKAFARLYKGEDIMKHTKESNTDLLLSISAGIC